MNDTLAIWNKFADIDPKFTKPITGKDYGGTSPNPQYVIRCLTELFGPVGEGFGWRIIQDGFKDFADDTVLHWCRIEFWHTSRANTFEAYGQTKAAYKTQKGSFRVDEDAPKKSLTDAITKAASQIGIASNIFLGRWDDSKYVAEVNQTFREAEKPPQIDSAKERDRIKVRIGHANSQDELAAIWKSDLDIIKYVSDPHFAELKKAFSDRKAALTQADPAMQAPHEYQ